MDGSAMMEITGYQKLFAMSQLLLDNLCALDPGFIVHAKGSGAARRKGGSSVVGNFEKNDAQTRIPEAIGYGRG